MINILQPKNNTVGKLRKVFFLLSLFVLTLLPAVVPAAQLRADIRIHPDDVTGSVNRYILGNNFIGSKAGSDPAFFNNYGGGCWDPVKETFSGNILKSVQESGVSVLRWPGGGWHKSLDWKQVIGPVSKRPDQKFGLPEFVLLCEHVGAIPLITLTTDRYKPEELADFVEYLNSPNDHSNPNGGIDWAARRAQDGYPTPWGVKWFEFGNESFNIKNPISVHDYVKKFKATYTAMKKIDPQIKMGAVLADNTSFEGGWTSTVIKELGPIMDFAAIHPYIPKVTQKAAEKFSSEEIALGAVSSDADLIYKLAEYNQLIHQLTGRSDLPLAATEFNGHFVQDQPTPFRHSLANAIHNADFLRIFLNPKYHLKLATYWQMLNSYWGMIRGGYTPGKNIPLSLDPTFYVYKIYNKYLGEHVVRMSIDAPTFDYSGAFGVSSRNGKPRNGQWSAFKGELPNHWHRRWFSKGEQSEDNGVVHVTFPGDDDTNYYHAHKVIKVNSDTLYKVSVRARTIDVEGGKIGIIVQDSRGWNKTFYQAENMYLQGTTPWSWLTVNIMTYHDTQKIRIMPRRIPNGHKIKGSAEFGEVRIEESGERFGAVQSVVGVASVSKGGDEVSVVVINKNLHENVEAVLHIEGNYRIVDSDTMSGPNPFVTNLSTKKEDQIVLKKADLLPNQDGSWSIKLPPLSANGIRMRRVLPGGANGS